MSDFRLSHSDLSGTISLWMQAVVIRYTVAVEETPATLLLSLNMANEQQDLLWLVGGVGANYSGCCSQVHKLRSCRVFFFLKYTSILYTSNTMHFVCTVTRTH